MLRLARGESLKLAYFKALNRRAYLSDDELSSMKRLHAGFRGEQWVDTHWQEIAGEYYLYHDFQTASDTGTGHQIDTIFLCKHFLLAIEIKNISGHIMIDSSTHQFIRKRVTGEVEGFKNPINQIERHAQLLLDVLERLGIELPVLRAIIITNPSTIIEQIPTGSNLFHVSGLASFIDSNRKYYPPVLNDSLVGRIQRELELLHQPKDFQKSSEIVPFRKGVLCVCGQLMTFVYGGFHCNSSCKVDSMSRLLEGLIDYRVLVDEIITNKQFREFFGIESIFAATRLLNKLPLEISGTKKGRKYKIVLEKLRSQIK